MDQTTYLIESARTASKLPQEESIITKEMLERVGFSLTSAALADVTKREIFYKDTKTEERLTAQGKKIIAIEEKIFNGEAEYSVPVDQIDIFHAILGLISESGELAEEFINSILDNRTIDVVNLKEELGDHLWYISLALRAVGSSYEEIMETNINKLKKRFPEKFTSENALNRDLIEERKVLEGE